MILYADFETRSRVDLKTRGLDNYARACEPLMLAWAVDLNQPAVINDNEVRMWFPSEPLPDCLLRMLLDPAVTKVAQNCMFERMVLKYGAGLGIDSPADQWQDTSVLARTAGLPSSLADISDFLKLEEGKDPEGSRLIKKFCVPDKKTGDFKDWNTDPEDWQKFVAYCQRDVMAEREIYRRLSCRRFTAVGTEREVYLLDQKINERGIPVDLGLVRKLRTSHERIKDSALATVAAITGAANPNSREQVLEWLKANGYEPEGLTAGEVDEALQKADGDVKAVLEARQITGKSSFAKLDALESLTGSDGRLRHSYKYYGAHTGRWSAGGNGHATVQLQNFPRGIPGADLASLLARVRAGDETLTADELATCLRSVFIAPEGKTLLVGDYSQIELRVLAWLSGCRKLQEGFAAGLDVYTEFAKDMYGVEAVEKFQRQIAKSAVLGCGYQLSGTGFQAYAQNMGIDIDEAQAAETVAAFRSTYPEVPSLWWALEEACLQAVKTRQVVECDLVKFVCGPKLLSILLPSGGCINYPRPELVIRATPWGKAKETVRYEGPNPVTKKWGHRYLYGGKITENIVQRIARDLLAYGMLQVYREGFEVLAHTHDEIVAAGLPDQLAVFESAMSGKPEWAYGLTQKVEAYSSHYYRK
jgi:DNA polymerase